MNKKVENLIFIIVFILILIIIFCFIKKNTDYDDCVEKGNNAYYCFRTNNSGWGQ